MSYMNTHAAFAPAGGIEELSFDEIDVVNGAGLFSFLADWFSHFTQGWEINIQFNQVSDGVCNLHDH